MPSKPVLLKFKFDGFEGLPSEPGKSTRSEQVTDSQGNTWKLILFPGGRAVESARRLSVYLKNAGTKDVHAKCAFVLRNERGEVFKENRISTRLFEANKNMITGLDKFVRRPAILDQENGILADGALLLDVELQYKEESSPFKHLSSLSSKMLQLLESEDHADLIYDVSGTIFTAHKNILSLNAPVLFSFGEENDGGSSVPINDIAPDVFRIILRYVYGEEIPVTQIILDDGKEIIDASNKYGVTGLKLAVEAVLVESLLFTVENVADWLIFADSKVCPLLKEKAMAYFLARSHDILNSESSSQLKESPTLLTELMMEISKSSMGFVDGGSASVDELRKQLLDKGLEIDGSKEILISRLRESNQRQRVE